MKSRVIGLTGQTGAGKSTAARIIASEYGCSIVDADMVAREALAPGSSCLKRLAEIFGYDIIDEKGECRRRLLAQRAFSSKENTEKLNLVTHPWIIRRSREYIELYRRDPGGIILFDCPLLFECGGETLCDLVIAVTAPEELRLERIINRDGLTQEEAMQRIGVQNDTDYYTQRADYVIDGSRSMDEIKAELLSVIGEKLL